MGPVIGGGSLNTQRWMRDRNGLLSSKVVANPRGKLEIHENVSALPDTGVGGGGGGNSWGKGKKASPVLRRSVQEREETSRAGNGRIPMCGRLLKERPKRGNWSPCPSPSVLPGRRNGF